MSEQPQSVRAHAIAELMFDGHGRRPELADFTYLDAGAPPAPSPAPGPAPVEPSPVAPPPPVAGQGWDMAAFDRLPPETRTAVMAGAAHQVGRGFLELEAASELIRPADVHLHLTDPAKYVDGQGRVDREAVRADLYALTRERPELGRYGNGPGQVGARPDERRKAAPEHLVGGSGAGHAESSLQARVAAAKAVMDGIDR